MIEIPAVIKKAEISVAAALMQQGNSAPATLAGVTYPAGRLRFETFAGCIRMEDRLYEGVLRFTEVSEPCETLVDFATIPGFSEKGVGDGV